MAEGRRACDFAIEMTQRIELVVYSSVLAALKDDRTQLRTAKLMTNSSTLCSATDLHKGVHARQSHLFIILYI